MLMGICDGITNGLRRIPWRWSLALVVALLLSVGCGGESDPAVSQAPTATDAPTVQVRVTSTSVTVALEAT